MLVQAARARGDKTYSINRQIFIQYNLQDCNNRCFQKLELSVEPFFHKYIMELE